MNPSMPLCRLMDLPLPPERSCGFLPVPLVQEPALAERLQFDHEWVGQLQFSTCLHPDARDYFVRLANIFSLGAFYYPLYTVAAQQSLIGLELALKTRFRFETSAFTSLRALLDHVTMRRLLLFEQTEAVRISHKHEEEMCEYGFSPRTPRDIAEIARNRENVMRCVLPKIRNNAAHPTIAGLTLPGMAYSALEHAIELANIVYDESELSLKAFVSAVGIRMDEVNVVERYVDSGNGRFSRPIMSNPVTKRDACSVIEKAARNLGIHSKACVSFSALQGLGLVPNAALPISEIFRGSFNEDYHLKAEHSEACIALLSSLAEAERRLSRILSFEHHDQRFTARFVRIRNGHKWVIDISDSAFPLSFELDMGELSYFSLLKAGLASSLKHATNEVRGLSTLVGQRPDAFRWEKLSIRGEE